MKRLIVLFSFLLILPAMAFAQWGVGGAPFLKSPVLIGQEVDIEELNIKTSSGLLGVQVLVWR